MAYLLGCLCRFGYDEAVLLLIESTLSIAVVNSSIAAAVLLVCIDSRASFTDSCTASKSPAVRFPSAPGVVCPCAVEANPTDVTNIPDSKDDVSVAYNINAYELIRISIQ